MRTIIIITAFFVASLSAQAQLANTIIISSNDVVRNSIWVGHPRLGTNDTRVVVKLAFTETGAKHLEEFCQSHTVGDKVFLQCGDFVHAFPINGPKIYPRTGFILSAQDAEALVAGLRGEE